MHFPLDTNASKILLTLQYANWARNIQNAPIGNVDAMAMDLLMLRALKNLLKKQLIRQRFNSSFYLAAATDPGPL